MLNIFVAVIVFFLGASIESAINCAAYRVPRGMDWIHGHSTCESCGHILQWYELVPVISCCVLRGKCRKCGEKFGMRHAVLEAMCGAVFAGVFISDSMTVAVRVALLIAALFVFILIALLVNRNEDK